jgi:hypothetical protein
MTRRHHGHVTRRRVTDRNMMPCRLTLHIREMADRIDDFSRRQAATPSVICATDGDRPRRIPASGLLLSASVNPAPIAAIFDRYASIRDEGLPFRVKDGPAWHHNMSVIGCADTPEAI